MITTNLDRKTNVKDIDKAGRKTNVKDDDKAGQKARFMQRTDER
jgi:hypothetical protein